MVDRDERGHAPLGLIILALLLLGALVLCLTCAPYQPPATAPAGFGNPDSTSRDSILSYARGLVFDSNMGAGDRQRLMMGATCPPWVGGGNCTYGPLATIEPQVGSYRIPDSTALAAGRIIARIITADSQYAKLGLKAGDTTYWWVDKRGPSGWRSVLIPSDTASPLVHRDSLDFHPVYPVGHHSYAWRQSVARFYWNETDETLWGTCTNGHCCKMQ